MHGYHAYMDTCESLNSKQSIQYLTDCRRFLSSRFSTLRINHYAAWGIYNLTPDPLRLQLVGFCLMTAGFIILGLTYITL
jgi:hypothetical protein